MRKIESNEADEVDRLNSVEQKLSKVQQLKELGAGPQFWNAYIEYVEAVAIKQFHKLIDAAIAEPNRKNELVEKQAAYIAERMIWLVRDTYEKSTEEFYRTTEEQEAALKQLKELEERGVKPS